MEVEDISMLRWTGPTLDVRSYEAGQDKQLKNKGTTKMGGIAKNVQERRLKWYPWACDEMRGAECRNDDDGNESREEKEERNARRWLDRVMDDYEGEGREERLREDGWTERGIIMREKEERNARRWLDRVLDDIKEKGLLTDEVIDRATSYIDPT